MQNKNGLNNFEKNIGFQPKRTIGSISLASGASLHKITEIFRL